MTLFLLQACNSSDAVAPLGHGAEVALPVAVKGTPRLASLAPDTVLAGQTLVLSGQDLPATLGSVRVRLGDVSLDLRAASSTRLEVAVPLGAFPCSPASTRRLEVLIDGVARLSQDVTVRMAQPVTLAPGQSVTALPASGCIELVAAGQAEGAVPTFMMALVNSDTDLSRVASVSVQGIGNAASAVAGLRSTVSTTSAGIATSAAAAAPAARVSRGGSPGGLPGGSPGGTPGGSLTEPRSGSLQDATPAHGTLLGEQSRLLGDPGALRAAWQRRTNAAFVPAAAPSAVKVGRSTMAARAAHQVGDTLTMTALLNSCTAGQPVTARVVYAGTRALVLEDLRAPRAGHMDQSYRAIGVEFDTLVYPLLTQEVGDPLAMDALMAGDGRVTMLFTRFVNDSAPGTAGYVSACNFHARSTFPASNEDEVFYVRTATLSETPDEWRRSIRATVVHEAKHLASFAERLARGVPLEETWLEEATARVAEELYARRFPGGGAWRGNTGFAGSLECELLQCDDRPLVMWRHFSQLYGYLQSADALSPLGPTSAGDVSWYASGWSLVRFALDRYVDDEGMGLRRLVRGDAGRGLAALEAVAGTKARELLSAWALANAGLAGGAGADRGRSSWNLSSMWTGLARLYAGVYDGSPLRTVHETLGSAFTSRQQVAAGSAGYLVLQGSGSAASQVLQLVAGDGSSATSAALHLSVARVR